MLDLEIIHDWETAATQAAKMPARGKHKPSEDEQDGDYGHLDDTSDSDPR